MPRPLEQAFAELSELPEHEQAEIAAWLLAELDSRRRAESSIVQRLSLLFEQSPLAIVEWTLDFVVIGWNPAAEAMFGYTRDEALGRRGDLLIIAPEARESVATLWEALKVRTASARNINDNVTKEGRVITCEWHNIPLLDKDGRVISVAAFAQDITERRQAEEALRASQQRLALVLMQSPYAIIEWNLTHQIQEWNPAAEKMFGFTREEALGKPAIDWLVPANARATVVKVFEQLTAQNEVVYSVNENITKDGRIIFCEWSNVPLVDRDGNKVGLASMATDVTDRVRAEHELQMAKEMAESASRAKSTFLASISHELRTPMNAILGFAQVMERDTSLTPRQREYVDIISRSGEHLLGLINDVLEISKIEAGRVTLQPVSYDLHAMLRGVEEMLKIRADARNLQLYFEVGQEVPQYVHGDENKLRQILINLIGNGIKFTSEGGVTLRVRFTDGSAMRLLFEVEDTGEGIAEHDLPRLFQPFVQAGNSAKSHEGSGLGLAISRQFVELMGGTISVQSVVGQGTLFTFDVEISVVGAQDVLDKKAQRRVIGIDPADKREYRILVVDDTWENRRLLIEWLRQVGFEVREAANGREAIDIWQTWQPHLIWMDIRMPVMDGYEATQIIKSSVQGQATVVIALTASILDQDQAAVRAAGCDDFVRKPVRASLIYDKIAEYLGVRFIYDDPGVSAPDQPAAETESVLTPKALGRLPEQWVMTLRRAADEIDVTMVRKVTDQIRAQDKALAEALDQLIDSYRFDQLQALLQQVEPQ